MFAFSSLRDNGAGVVFEALATGAVPVVADSAALEKSSIQRSGKELLLRPELSIFLWRRVSLLQRFKSWSLASLQHRLVKTGGPVVAHARYHGLALSNGHLHRRLFGDMLGRIWVLPMPTVKA